MGKHTATTRRPHTPSQMVRVRLRLKTIKITLGKMYLRTNAKWVIRHDGDAALAWSDCLCKYIRRRTNCIYERNKYADILFSSCICGKFVVEHATNNLHIQSEVCWCVPSSAWWWRRRRSPRRTRTSIKRRDIEITPQTFYSYIFKFVYYLFWWIFGPREIEKDARARVKEDINCKRSVDDTCKNSCESLWLEF